MSAMSNATEVTCPRCSGRGEVEGGLPEFPGEDVWEECHECDGAGVVSLYEANAYREWLDQNIPLDGE